MSGLSQWSTEPAQWYRYNGKERDTLSGWYEYGFRWYDAAIGRFTGVDPIADQFVWASVFNYAENEPVGHIDLHGLQAALEIEMDRDIKAYVQGKMSRDEYCKRIQARGMGAIAGMGIGIAVLGGGKLASIGAGWILRNPVVATEAAKTIGGVMWGLTTDQDMPGGGDDAGRALKYGPLREGLAGGKIKGGGTVKFANKVSRQKMERHLKGSVYNDSKGYFDSLEDAQEVLDSYNSGNYRLISEDPSQNSVTIEVKGVTGRHVSKAAPGTNQVDVNVPTNIFTIQSSSAPKPIPVNPKKGHKI